MFIIVKNLVSALKLLHQYNGHNLPARRPLRKQAIFCLIRVRFSDSKMDLISSPAWHLRRRVVMALRRSLTRGMHEQEILIIGSLYPCPPGLEIASPHQSV